MKFLHKLAFILLVIGGLNWLLLGVFWWDIGHLFSGDMMSIPARVIYTVVGIATIYVLATHKSDCKACAAGPM
ncbi:MAG: DUF378 domain-containing protein [Candidatus Doudnabacteria bacterium]|nr:DUF378 domain-containing protein [Candidatus Doudnabacteria bacterium]